MTHKLATGFTPFHLVYGEDALMPINVLFPSIQMVESMGLTHEQQTCFREVALHDVFWDRDMAVRWYLIR